MKEEHIWSKKPESMLDWFCVVGACIALYLTLNNLGYFLGKIGAFIGIVSPFAGGIVIAYVLDPMVKFFYTKLFKEKKKTRGFAILLAYLVAILLLVLLAWLVIPQIVDSIAMLFTNFPSYIHSVQDMLGMIQERFGVDLSSATKVLDDSEAMVKEIYSMASAAMPQIVASIGSVASNFVAIFTSIAASIYMLADKEHLLHQLRTLAHAFLPEKAAENTLRICHYANVNFTGFFVGKIIDSAIIGVITFVAMAILRLDFALLISVFIGITNIVYSVSHILSTRKFIFPPAYTFFPHISVVAFSAAHNKKALAFKGENFPTHKMINIVGNFVSIAALPPVWLVGI